MKNYRILLIVLAVLLGWFACVQLSGCRKRQAEQPKEMWHTNTVELWHTNTVEKWATNVVEVVRTNTLVQTVTNQVIKEVASPLSTREQEAARAGLKYLNAPSLAGPSDALYKASPVALDVQLSDRTAKLLGREADAVKKNIEVTLRSRSIPLADKSPYRLEVDLNTVWTTDVPDVTLLLVKLELRESVAVMRQNDLVKCDGAVWGTTVPKLVRRFKFADEVKAATREALAKFSDDYLKAREDEKKVAARIPASP